MKSNYYKMFPEQEFAIVKFQSETISYQEAKMINYKYKMDRNYPKIQYLLIIIDERCRPEFNIKDLKRLSDSYNTEFQMNNHKTIVWLVSAPIATAFAHVFVSNTKDNSLYCSTLDKAFELLEIPIQFEEFEKLVQN